MLDRNERFVALLRQDGQAHEHDRQGQERKLLTENCRCSMAQVEIGTQPAKGIHVDR